MPEKFTLAGVQMDPKLMDKEANLAAMIDAVEQAVAKGARLVVFPECTLTGYCFDSRQEAFPYAESIPGPSTRLLEGLCRRTQAYLVAGMLEKDGDRCFNAAVLIGPEGVVGKYRKVHLPYLGVDRFVDPGDLGFGVHQTRLGRIGLNICYDGSFPESARTMALGGADMILLPTNWPTGAEEFADFLVNARGLENKVYSVAVNRVGRERGFRFIGRSRIADPSGRTLALAGPEEEDIIFGEIDPSAARDKHITRVPGKHEINRFKDRRPQYYGKIVEPFGSDSGVDSDSGGDSD